MTKEENQYYDNAKYEVLENKFMILVYKKTLFGNLPWRKCFATEFYEWEEDANMFIIKRKKRIRRNQNEKKSTDNWDYRTRRKFSSRIFARKRI